MFDPYKVFKTEYDDKTIKQFCNYKSNKIYKLKDSFLRIFTAQDKDVKFANLVDDNT